MEIKSTNRFLEDSTEYVEILRRFFRFNSKTVGYILTKCLAFLIFTVPLLLLSTVQLVYRIVFDSLFVIIEIVFSHGFLTLIAMNLEVFLLVPLRMLLDFLIKLFMHLFFIPEKLFK